MAVNPGNGLLMAKIPFSPGPHSAPSGVTTRASMPGSGIPDDPGLMGSIPSPQGLPTMGPEVSVCHMWSMTGIRSSSTSFWSHSQAGALSTSPAQKTRSSEPRSCSRATSAP